MPRFIGIKDNYICIVSDKSFNHENINVIEVPKEFENLSSEELIINCKFRDGSLRYKHSNKQAKDLKIALIGNWKMRCGISSYAENLWPKVVKHLKDFKLFVEDNDLITSNIYEFDGTILDKNQVLSCWKRGESLQKLIDSLKEYDPDIIWIQHEFGLWSNASYWLSMMSQLSDYRIIVTQHSVFHHKDKAICEAAMPEIVTHLQGGKDTLINEKHIQGKVYVIPHGCFLPVKEKVWNMYKSTNTFMQFGFGFRYKGWENSIKAAAILKEKYPDVFFTGLFSESPYNKVEHQIYYNELITLIDSLNLKENVAIIRGYQSDFIIDTYLRANTATVFPYVSHPEHEVYGASGAARLAMAKCVPVITTSVNHFSDLNTIKADTPEQIANELNKLFKDSLYAKHQIDAQNIYLENNSWDNVALKYIELFENRFI